MVAELVDGHVSSGENVMHHARIVRELALLRRVIRTRSTDKRSPSSNREVATDPFSAW
jgi:hypothetical protein